MIWDKKIPYEVAEEWINLLRKKGLEENAATNIVYLIRSHPLLLSGKDTQQALEKVLKEFDLSWILEDEEEIKREMMEIYEKSLGRVPIVSLRGIDELQSEEIGDKSGIAVTLYQIATIHQKRGEYDKALNLYEEAKNIFEEIGDKSGIAVTLYQIATIHQKRGEYDKALNLYEEAKNIFEEIGDKSGIASTLHQIAMIHQKRGEI